MHGGKEAARARAGEADGIVVRPRRYLYTQGTLTVIALLLPVFAVLFWLTIPPGTWPVVLLAALATIAVFARLVMIYRRAAVIASPSGVHESGFFGPRRRIERAEIGSLLYCSLYRGATLDTEEHLYVLGTSGRVLLRMRGRYWSADGIRRVVEALGLPTTGTSEPLTREEFARAHPGLRMWPTPLRRPSGGHAG